LGKAFCKVDATFGSIAAGDLLTTSATRGYAMKVSDINQALGAIIGKALARFEGGRGIIPMMVSLR
jgi:protein gp37